MSKEPQIGTLVVVVLKARNLNDKHAFYKQDVYAQVTLNGVTKKTPVAVKGGQHPMWDTELRFSISKQESEKTRTLEVACFAEERRGDDLLGKGIVDIKETLRTMEFDEWVSLGVEGVVRGDIYLEMTYFPNTPNSSTVPNAGRNKRPTNQVATERLDYLSQADNGRSNGRRIPAEPSPRPSRLSSVSSQKHADSPLPPLPDPAVVPLPGSLLPGGVKPKPQVITPALQQVLSDPSPVMDVPTMLRPGTGAGGQISLSAHYAPPAGRSTLTSTTLQPSQLHGQSLAHGPAPHAHVAASVPAASPYLSPVQQPIFKPSAIPGPAPYRQPTSVPALWAPDPNATAGHLFFPVPSTPALPEIPGAYPTHPPPQHRQDSDLPDPYLRARYQTPLPLPPDSGGLFQERKGPSSTPLVRLDQERVVAIRLAEEEAARRKEQADRDLELALQLDRELNL